jgi:hypothetical protein
MRDRLLRDVPADVVAVSLGLGVSPLRGAAVALRFEPPARAGVSPLTGGHP